MARSRRPAETAKDATAPIRDAIRAHVPDAVAELARLAREASSETARVAAINALIDRGYGRLKEMTDDHEAAARGITVRFVAPGGGRASAGKPARARRRRAAAGRDDPEAGGGA